MLNACFDHRYAASGQLRPVVPGRVRRSLKEYEREGTRFYRLAGEHPTARAMELSEVFALLQRHFHTATKPLSFIAAHCLHSTNDQLFGAPSL